jgi:ferritin-like metal-binding protein YciE
MADEKLQQKLVDYIEDAHAMEQNVSTMLTSMISTTDDPEIKEMLEHHKEETERQESRLRERLDALGAGTSTRKQAQTVAAALVKGATDVARGDQAGKNARDGYTTEHMEIAATSSSSAWHRRPGTQRLRRWLARTGLKRRRWPRR